MKMNKHELRRILKLHAEWLDSGKTTGEKANLRRADLHNADLHNADLRYANLNYADLHNADLRYANLNYANLNCANLHNADLHNADLRCANLHYADLRHADLRYANLNYADIDYSCWPLWCGSREARVDKRIAAQLAAHFCALDCDDQDYQAAREALLPFARTSHRAEDLGLL
jgi:hypothetical protein